MKLAYFNEPFIAFDIDHLDDMNNIINSRSRETSFLSKEETEEFLRKIREHIKNNPPVFINHKTADDWQ